MTTIGHGTTVSDWTYGHRELPSADLLVRGLALLVHSNVFIALAATGVAVSTMLLVGVPLEAVPLFIVFAATLFVYSLDRVTDLEGDQQDAPRRTAYLRRFGTLWLAAGVVLYLAAIGLAVALGLPRAEFLVLPLVAALLYSVFRLKRVLLVKNLLVGGAWGVIPLGVGVYYGVLWTVEILFLAGFFTVMLAVAAAVFDVRDRSSDRAEGVRTFPLVVGPRATRRGAVGVTLAAGAVVVAAVASGVLPTQFLLLLAFLGYVLAYLPFATPDRGSLFYGFVVDGEHVFLAALALAFL